MNSLGYDVNGSTGVEAPEFEQELTEKAGNIHKGPLLLLLPVKSDQKKPLLGVKSVKSVKSNSDDFYVDNIVMQHLQAKWARILLRILRKIYGVYPPHPFRLAFADGHTLARRRWAMGGRAHASPESIPGSLHVGKSRYSSGRYERWVKKLK